MNENYPTLAIYGIQDRQDFEFPLYVHDHNLTLMKNGEVIRFLQQERISRKKRDNTLYIHLKEILKEKKLLAEDYDLVFVDNLVGRSFITSNGEARFEAPLNQFLANGLEKGKCWWFGKEREAYVLNHELAHIFSCLPFYGNFKENSLLVHFDGGASLSNFSAAFLKKEKINWLEYNWDMKPYSSLYNANALVFSIIGAKLRDQNSVPGKFMGYAGLGEYNHKIEEWLMVNNFFQDIWGKTSLFIGQLKKDFGIDLQYINQKDKFIQDVAATMQQIFIKQVLKKVSDLAEYTGAKNLYYTGGSALNIVSNTKIIESGIFKNIYIPPCTEDSGLSLGAAAFAEWKKHKKIREHNSYLNNWGINNYKVEYSPATIKKLAEKIVQKKVIGICNGFGEAGPRALGNRSIIALACSKKIARQISIKMKGRAWYQPLAPVALEKNIKYFTGSSSVNQLSKFMLLDFPVQQKRIPEIEGTVHADRTARFQVVFKKEENPFLFDLLEYLDLNYGIKALLNTSFNGFGEPIVHTAFDALKTAKKIKLDYLVINGKIKSLNEE